MKLERSLNLSAVIAISISAMLGSGIFILPSIGVAYTGGSIWLAYLAAAFSVLPAALSKAELATAMPTSGGTYVYIDRTFGPLAGTISGLGLSISLLLKSSFALVGFGAYLSVIADIPLKTTALGLLFVITVLNILGVKKVSSVLIFIVSVCLTSLVGLSTGGLFSFNPEYLEPLFRGGSEGFIAASGLLVVSFAGVTKIAAIAEEVKQPEKNLPRGILVSLFLVTIIYVFISLILVGHIRQENLIGDLHPIYTLATSIGGGTLGIAFAALAIATMASMANAGILAASRFPFAMSRDQLLPKFFGKLNSRFLSPVWSILFSSIIVATSISFLEIEKIAKLASAFMIVMYTLVNITVILLRENRVQWYQPGYKSPFYPWLQILGVLGGMTLLAYMGQLVVVAMVIVIVPGSLLYFFYGRKDINRKGVIGIRGRRKDLVESNTIKNKIECIDLSARASVLVALFGKERSPEIMTEMATALAGRGNVEVVHLTEVPEQMSLSDYSEDTAEIRALRRRINAMSNEKQTNITFDPLVSHDIFKTLNSITQGLHCHWLLVEWRGKSRGAFTIYNPMGWLKNYLLCNLITFRDSGVRYIRKILVYLKPGVNEGLVINTADHFAQVYNAEMTFVRFVANGANTEAIEHESNYLRHASQMCSMPTDSIIVRGLSSIVAVSSATVEFDLLVFGAMDQKKLMDPIKGSEDDKLISMAACSVINVRASKSLQGL